MLPDSAAEQKLWNNAFLPINLHHDSLTINTSSLTELFLPAREPC